MHEKKNLDGITTQMTAMIVNADSTSKCLFNRATLQLKAKWFIVSSLTSDFSGSLHKCQVFHNKPAEIRENQKK